MLTNGSVAPFDPRQTVFNHALNNPQASDTGNITQRLPRELSMTKKAHLVKAQEWDYSFANMPRYWFGIMAMSAGLGFYLVNNLVQATWESEDKPVYYTASDLPQARKILDVPEYDDAQTWHRHTVRKGQSLARIFSKFDIPQKTYKSLVNNSVGKNLLGLHPGQILKFRFANGQLSNLEFIADESYRISATRQGEGFAFDEHRREYEKHTRYASTQIDSSLFVSAQKAGVSNKITMELAKLFAWDIDFSLDIRKGDKFSVVYETLHLNGQKVKDGNIIAAEFINNGKTYRALRYTAPDGQVSYYSPDGINLRKTFLRSPVDFTRISSHFGTRKHPVLNRIRAHKGVDYAAPLCTPVRSTAHGKIIFQGKQGGFGKVIVVQHQNGYRTLYAHLDRYRSKYGLNTEVQQGEVIGYVGASGLATGPHLHYEFLVNGRHRNPLNIKFPASTPIEKQYLADFKLTSVPLMAMLDMVSNSQLAMNAPSTAKKS